MEAHDAYMRHWLVKVYVFMRMWYATKPLIMYTLHVLHLQFCNQALINCPDMRLTGHVPHSHTALRPIASFSYLRSCAKVGKMGVGETRVGEHARV